jgi:hypothetical protein
MIGTAGSNGTFETAGTVGTGLKITLNVEPLNIELPRGFERLERPTSCGGPVTSAPEFASVSCYLSIAL